MRLQAVLIVISKFIYSLLTKNKHVKQQVFSYDELNFESKRIFNFYNMELEVLTILLF